MRLLSTSLFVAVASCGAALSAQTFTPRSIVFDGAPQYQQADLLAASGLAVGKPVTQATLDAVTQKLGDIGVFTNITFTTSGTTLSFALEPTPEKQMRNPVFTNFVIADSADLNAKLRQLVPLYIGSVPVVGNMQQTIERALEAILKERSINATVTSIGGAGRNLDFAIATPPVKVASVSVDGADFAGTPALAETRRAVVDSDYIEKTSGDALKQRLIEAYQDLGNLDASIGPVTHGPPQITPDKITVALTGTAAPGALYRVAKLDLPAPVQGVPANDLTRTSDLKLGGPASRILSLSTKVHLTALFQSRGYLEATTTIEPSKDATAHTMSYTFRTTTGDVYHLRALRTESMDPQQAKDATEAWKLAPGAVFDRTAIAMYLHKQPAATLCHGRVVEVKELREKASHQVDVVLTCATPRT